MRKRIEGRTILDRARVSPTRHLFRGEGAELARVRDAQRSRVSRAEAVLGERYGWRDLTFPELVAMVRELEGSSWWQGSPKTTAQRIAATEYEVTVRRGTARDRRATARPEVWELRIPEHMAARWVVVHEMAHLIAPENGHGPAWVGCYLEGLVAAGLEEGAEILARSMRAGGVRGAKAPEHYRRLEVPDYPEDGRLFPLELVG